MTNKSSFLLIYSTDFISHFSFNQISVGDILRLFFISPICVNIPRPKPGSAVTEMNSAGSCYTAPAVTDELVHRLRTPFLCNASPYLNNELFPVSAVRKLTWSGHVDWEPGVKPIRTYWFKTPSGTFVMLANLQTARFVNRHTCGLPYAARTMECLLPAGCPVYLCIWAKTDVSFCTGQFIRNKIHEVPP